MGEELKDIFGGAEVGKVKGAIGIQNTDEGDGREVESFGDHLGTDKDICFSRFELFKEKVVGSFVAGCVGVHPEGPDIGEEGVESPLNLFGADPFEVKGCRSLAGGAGDRGRGNNIRAKMAGEVVCFFVEGETDGAVGAFYGRATTRAHLKGVVPATIEKEKGLFPFF